MRSFSLIQALTHIALTFTSLLVNPVYSAEYTNPDIDFFTTTDGDKYAYKFIPAQGENETFLLLHGYPSSHKDWEAQIEALTAEGFGVLAPDMLGFGASDMPTEVKKYDNERLSDQLIELLDHKNVELAIGVGHDWGAGILTRLAVYHQDRFSKFVFLSVGYLAPGGFFDLDAINAMNLAKNGYMNYGYWYFFDRYDSSTLIRDHVSLTLSQ